MKLHTVVAGLDLSAVGPSLLLSVKHSVLSTPQHNTPGRACHHSNAQSLFCRAAPQCHASVRIYIQDYSIPGTESGICSCSSLRELNYVRVWLYAERCPEGYGETIKSFAKT